MNLQALAPQLLDDTPATVTDRDHLARHLRCRVLHASRTRAFANSYIRRADGTATPRMYRIDSEALARCEYAVLTHRQFAACIVLDVDREGTPGGHPSNLHPDVSDVFSRLIAMSAGPNWVGINPITGKAQAIWLIHPAYADQRGQSPSLALLAAVQRNLGSLLGADAHFSHRFSRNPFHTAKTPTSYRWYCQHHGVYDLRFLMNTVRNSDPHTPQPRGFSSGRELIETVKKRREQAQALRELAHDVQNELGAQLDQLNPDLVQGVRIIWQTSTRSARDETAFRHALKTAHRLRNEGKRMTDAAIIDAFEHAFLVAHREGGDGRPLELPSMRDRQTMARRVRGYVLSSSSSSTTITASASLTLAQRKALATMGRRGGQKAAERWNDRTSHYAQAELAKLAQANQLRAYSTDENKGRILAFVASSRRQGHDPTTREIADELSLSVRRVQELRRELGISAKRGRPNKKSAVP